MSSQYKATWVAWHTYIHVGIDLMRAMTFGEWVAPPPMSTETPLAGMSRGRVAQGHKITRLRGAVGAPTQNPLESISDKQFRLQ